MRVTRLAVAAFLVAAAWVALPAPPVLAAACSTSSGVTVVADFNDLGGGVPEVCVADGAGKHASDLFPEATLPLTYAQREPGFVCRVSGLPTSDPCVNTSPSNAYWGLWSSDGKPGSSWTYASVGVGSLTIPAGGLVALSWDDVSGQAPPSAPAARPAVASPAPSPTSTAPQPAPHPAPHSTPPAPTSSSTPTAAPTTPAPAGPTTTSAAPVVVPTTPTTRTSTAPTPTPRHRQQTTIAPNVEPPAAGLASDDPVPVAAPSAADGGLPGWVGPLVVIALFGAAGGTLLWRRRVRP